MRYVVVPAPFEVLDPITKRTIGNQRCAFIDSVRIALVSAFQKGASPQAQKVPQSKLDDIDEAFADAVEGDVVKMEDDSWKILADEFTCPNPSHFTPQWAVSSKTHRRAVLQAAETKPAGDAEAASDSDSAAVKRILTKRATPGDSAAA